MLEHLSEYLCALSYVLLGGLIAPAWKGSRVAGAWANSAYASLKRRTGGFLSHLKEGAINGLIIALALVVPLLIAFEVIHTPLILAVSASLLGVLIPGLVISYLHQTETNKKLQAVAIRELTLDGTVEPDGAPHHVTVHLKSATAVDRYNFVNEFLAVPAGAKSVTLLLRQTRRKCQLFDPPFTLESMKRQLEKRDSDDRVKGIVVKWVVIKNKHDTFAAYISYERFSVDILKCGKAAYAELLNLHDLAEFKEAVAKHKGHAKELQDACLTEAATISELGDNVLPIGLSRREALLAMIKNDWKEAMLVTEDFKPHGMVTLFGVLKQGKVESTLGLGDSESLAQKVDKRIADARIRAKEIEAINLPSLPDPAGDDDPLYDSMIPPGIPQESPASPLTPP